MLLCCHIKRRIAILMVTMVAKKYPKSALLTFLTLLCDILITCGGIIGRTDISGRKVATKLVLYLTENVQPSVKSKVVLHFYHTSSTLQAQGSSLLSCGSSAPAWLVKNFLEPLASSHASQNCDAINAINANIRQSRVFTCGYCRDPINPTATHPKDQELPCSKCTLLYHKKCTDRRKTTANWRKTPWFCQRCILGPL